MVAAVDNSIEVRGRRTIGKFVRYFYEEIVGAINSGSPAVRRIITNAAFWGNEVYDIFGEGMRLELDGLDEHYLPGDVIERFNLAVSNLKSIGLANGGISRHEARGKLIETAEAVGYINFRMSGDEVYEGTRGDIEKLILKSRRLIHND